MLTVKLHCTRTHLSLLPGSNGAREPHARDTDGLGRWTRGFHIDHYDMHQTLLMK